MSNLRYIIELKQPKRNDFGAQLDEVVRFLFILRNNPAALKIDIDLSKIRFVFPLFVLAIFFILLLK